VKRPDAATAAAVVLFVVYALTLAPDVTFWDAGEFIAAAHALGIPHPPGTPLFILIANVWAKAVPLAFPVATNLLSAAATALAAFVTARLVLRGTANGPMALSAALAAGSMSTAWLNATETEVYALTLALGLLIVAAGYRAGAEDDERWTRLTAYLMALAVPLHLSALVTAPVAIALAAGMPAPLSTVRWRRVALLSGAFVATIAVGRMSLWLAVAGSALILGSTLVPSRADGRSRPRVAAAAGAVLALVAIASSAILFLLVRAQFDPGINQGNPDTWERFAAVVARRQYAVAPLWPRLAPPWVQLANIGQYADWQVALSLGPTVEPSILRSAFTALFVWLAISGAAWHWNAHRRSWFAVAGLLACGTLGVMVYLNLRPGPSIGFPGLATDIAREARERDYFYVCGFWALGIWAGLGAVQLLREAGRPAWTGVLVAALPIALNWRAVTRNAESERLLPRQFAEALLEASPPNAVLFVSGDNDTYPLWYVQQVHGLRRDVAVVTIPLLGTRWYRDEMSRRHRLARIAPEAFEGRFASAALIADSARLAGRPVAASISLLPAERERIARAWTAGGPVYVAGPAGIDPVVADRWARRVRERVSPRPVRPAIDLVPQYFRAALECPRLFAEARHGAIPPPPSRLDSLCNYR